MLDIIEIDGASNNGVANVRELIERARFQPTSGKYKVYIIDEVHMLSSGAFNALLKTLEEPPSHVKFILATTELHKIPETIISRSQRYDFRKITEPDIVARLQYVANCEKIQADPRALELIARLARGGLRDALSLFEQYSIGGELSYEFIIENLSLVGDEFLDQVTDYIARTDLSGIREKLSDLRLRSIEPRRFLEQFLYFLRERAYQTIGTPNFSQIWKIFEALSSAYAKLKEFPDGFLLIEMTLLGLIGGGETRSPPISRAPSDAPKILLTEIVPPAPRERTITPSERPSVSMITPVSHSDSSSFSFTELVNHVKSTPKK